MVMGISLGGFHVLDLSGGLGMDPRLYEGYRLVLCGPYIGAKIEVM